MADLGKAYVQIVPSAEGLRGSITKILDPEGKKAGETSGKAAGANFGKKMMTAVKALGLGAAIVKTIKEGAEFEQLEGGIKKIFGDDAAATVIANSKKAFRTAGMSANQYLSSATAFSAKLMNEFGNDGKKAAEYSDKIMRQVADNANTYGKYSTEEIANVYQNLAKGNYTLLDNLNLGFGGSQQGMKDLLAKAEEISGKHFEFGNFADMADAIGVVQENIGIAGTAANEMAGTLEGSFNAMKNTASNFMVALTTGGDIKQSLADLTDTAVYFFIDNLAPALGKIVAAVPGVLIQLIGSTLPNIFSNISAMLDGLLSNNGTNSALKLGNKFGEALLPALGKLIPKIGEVFVKLAVTLPSVAASAAAGFIKGLGGKILGGIRDLVGRIKEHFRFNVSLPKVKLPHFSISPAGWKMGDLLKGTIPHLSIKWAAKGGIVDGATLVGAGEKGAEAIVPLDPFWRRLDAMATAMHPNNSFREAATPGIIEIVLDGSVIAKSTINYINGQVQRYGTSPLNV